MILLILASCIARITGVSKQHLAWVGFILTILLMRKSRPRDVKRIGYR
jgi:hypothetical protein